jgi:electron transfer flavoprotein alpha subunit
MKKVVVDKKELSETIQSTIELLGDIPERQKTESYLFTASSYGQQIGFISGFKLAIQLMCECNSFSM